MNKSDDIKELATALSKAQGEMKAALKDTENPFFHKKYADLASVWDACRDQLSKHGLSVIQLPGRDGDNVTCETILAHSTGQFISSEMSMKPVKQDPQGVGSCLTYLRRYALSAIVGICQDDDDGNNASGLNGKSSAKDHKKDKKNETDSPPLHPDNSAAASLIRGSGDNIFFIFLDTAKKAKAVIGEDQYRSILKAHGVEKANGANTKKLQESIHSDFVVAVETHLKAEKGGADALF